MAKFPTLASQNAALNAEKLSFIVLYIHCRTARHGNHCGKHMKAPHKVNFI